MADPLVADDSGRPTILVVPDKLFITDSVSQGQRGFVETLSSRMLNMIERLLGASLEETLFLLSQIRQALRKLDYHRHYDLFQLAQQGISIYMQLLTHTDRRVRFMVFDLIAIFRERFIRHADAVGSTIRNEIDSDTKARMIWAIEHLIAGGSSSSGIGRWTEEILTILSEINENKNEAPTARFAATNLLVRAQPGFLTPTIRSILIDALIQPEEYQIQWNTAYTVSQKTLKSIKNYCFIIASIF